MLLAFACLLGACDADPSQALVGRWQIVDEGAQMVIEFRADGTYASAAAGRLMDGQWELVSDHEIATWSRDDRPKRINVFRLEDGELWIEDRTGEHHRHRLVD